MKYTFLLPILFVAQLVNAQQTCEMQFQLITQEATGDDVDTVYIDVAQTSKKFMLNFSSASEGIQERFVLDSTARKVLELSNEEDEKIAFVSDLEASTEDELYGLTIAYELATNDLLGTEDYRLLSDKKTIQGWNCQKVELLEEGNVIGTGWMILGLHVGIEKETGFFSVKEGTLIEYTFKDDESGGFITLKLAKSSKTITNPAKTFSLEVPAGYELDTMEEDYYDDEEGE